MPSEQEKAQRKQLLDGLKAEQLEAFDQSLPLSRAQLLQLFDYLDNELQACDDTLKLTESFLLTEGVVNVDEVIQWLKANGGYCDCEVLNNIEEKFN